MSRNCVPRRCCKADLVRLSMATVLTPNMFGLLAEAMAVGRVCWPNDDEHARGLFSAL